MDDSWKNDVPSMCFPMQKIIRFLEHFNDYILSYSVVMVSNFLFFLSTVVVLGVISVIYVSVI